MAQAMRTACRCPLERCSNNVDESPAAFSFASHPLATSSFWSSQCRYSPTESKKPEQTTANAVNDFW